MIVPQCIIACMTDQEGLKVCKAVAGCTNLDLAWLRCTNILQFQNDSMQLLIIMY